MSHPVKLPQVFLDRSLGRLQVPSLLRKAGLNLVTLAEHYGVPADETIKDTDWLELVGTASYVAFMKDTQIRHNKEEAAALKEHGVRCFSLPAGNLGAEEMASRFLHNLPAITKACQRPGPFFYAVYKMKSDSRRYAG